MLFGSYEGVGVGLVREDELDVDLKVRPDSTESMML